MPKTDQGVFSHRYQVIPRTLIFITRGDEVLLLKGAPKKRLWANRYNGIGGHIERGEDVLSAARRELREEAGIGAVNLHLVGTVLINVEADAGIAIYVLRGEYAGGELISSDEGELFWARQNAILELPLVEDLYTLLPKVLAADGRAPFAARYWYDDQDRLQMAFAE